MLEKFTRKPENTPHNTFLTHILWVQPVSLSVKHATINSKLENKKRENSWAVPKNSLTH